MDRAEFLACTTKLALAAGGLATAQALPAAAQQPETARQAAAQRFREAWVDTLMQQMEAGLDEKSRVAVMEACGRACARRSSVTRLAASANGDVGAFVAKLGGNPGGPSVRLEGGVVHLSYPRCFCEMVAEGPARLPDLYCRCSEGWVKEVFETAVRKAVTVQTLQTIRRGADSCRFTIAI